MLVTCAWCTTRFVPKAGHQRYCGKICWSKQNYKKHKARIRLSQARYYAATAEIQRDRAREWKKKYNAAIPWTFLLRTAKYRAKKRNLPFDLTPEWAKSKWTGRCAMSQLPFSLNEKRTPFSPSIDRITPELGYVQSNCRFILFGINTLKSTASDDTVIAIARAIARHADPTNSVLLPLSK